MRLLPIDELKVPDNRQRREFDARALCELQESIEKFGLMQPIVVRDGGYMVAGERRLRAIREIWALDNSFHCHNSLVDRGMVPVIDLGDLSPIEAMEAELDENTKRRDLTWQEHAAAVAKLHEIRMKQNEGHTVRDTALEVEGSGEGYYHEKVRTALIVASHLSNPDVAKAKDAKEAFKILKRVEEAQVNAKRAAVVGQTFSSSDHVLLLGDCIETMETLPAGSFDAVITDPPYGMNADQFGDGAGKLTGITHEYSDTLESFKSLLVAAAKGIDRVCKPAAHLYVCCDIDQFHYLKAMFAQIGGWSVFRTPLINVKTGSGRVPLPEHGPRRQYEPILYAYRGGKRTLGIYSDVIHSEGDENLGHGAQKPVGLYCDLLRRSCLAGDRVLDPFAGTGTIFPAAHELKISATGIELEPQYYGIGVRRIEDLK